ncbi:hypothetical protein GCM10011584_11890 [Nocardioides phosphati]|uniref:DUF3043 domain-containing protein n=1 Tax=Nocardioides phosphati TaxID=1867775 RepID=A0ABQ2N7H4_9ACTN|nr:DUF3043 domain-containing protein [Nocardioides phosphati]GGO87390.1 hypothetical protein GCM10011584_11890 [Nocardioides phosphati]
MTPKPSDDAAPNATGKKGRPTPTRKEAEAAARARARLGSDPKAQRAAQKSRRKESMRELQAAYKTGDDSGLPERDKGPVKRLLRDVVDSRLGFAELFAPLLVLILVLSSINPVLGQGMWLTAVVLVVADLLWVRFKARREVRRRLPGKPLKGVTYYALVRSLQLRILRLPKPQVKIGQSLPDNYR